MKMPLIQRVGLAAIVAVSLGLNLVLQMWRNPSDRMGTKSALSSPTRRLSHEAWEQLLHKFQCYISNPDFQDDMALPVIIRQTEILCHPEHVDQLQYNLRFQMFVEMMQQALNHSENFVSEDRNTDVSSKEGGMLPRRRNANETTLRLPLPSDRSIPLVMRLGDGADCEGNIFPRFSWCTSGEGEHCHATAIPTFSLFRDMPYDSPEQGSFHRELELNYPWSSKQRQAIWRGIPTGIAPDGWASLHRAKLVNFSIHHGDLFDGAFVELGQFQDLYPDEASKLRKFSRFADRIEMNDYQKYRAIVDIDGNSWSSRLGNLLCMNSVVVKVYPRHKNYFFEELIPWQHYIPVKNDMSDLVDALRFAVSDEHEQEVKDIVYQANEWCRTRLTKREMAKDMFWMINDYVELIGDNDTRWNQWNEQMKFYEGNLSLVAIE